MKRTVNNIPTEMVARIYWTKHCGRYLRESRKEKNIPQIFVASQSAITRQYYSEIESGKIQSLSYDLFLLFCSILEINQFDFFNKTKKAENS